MIADAVRREFRDIYGHMPSNVCSHCGECDDPESTSRWPEDSDGDRICRACEHTTIPCPPAPILDQYAEICRIANVAAARCQRLSHDIRQALAMANSGRCEGLNRVLEARWPERCRKGRAA